jgi:CBS-domain-containing membrane protein
MNTKKRHEPRWKVEKALNSMEKHQIKRIPVTDDNRRVAQPKLTRDPVHG